MTKFVILCDPHFRIKTPVNRTDDIFQTQLRKFEYVLSFAEEVDAHLIIPGDLFHTPSVPDFVATNIVRLFKKYRRHCYYIYGNHDITGANYESAAYAKIGLAIEYDWFHLIDSKIESFVDCFLTGYNFSKEMECPESILLDWKEKEIPLICCVHSMIVNEPQLLIDGKYKTINWCTVQTNVSVIISGHYHPGFGIKENPLNTIFINPGAMTRLEASETEMKREPMFAVLEIDKGKIKTSLHKIPCDKNVFNLSKIIGKNIRDEERIQFMNALENLKDDDIMGNNILTILDNINIKELPQGLDKINEDIIEMCKTKVKEMIDK